MPDGGILGLIGHGSSALGNIFDGVGSIFSNMTVILYGGLIIGAIIALTIGVSFAKNPQKFIP